MVAPSCDTLLLTIMGAARPSISPFFFVHAWTHTRTRRHSIAMVTVTGLCGTIYHGLTEDSNDWDEEMKWCKKIWGLKSKTHSTLGSSRPTGRTSNNSRKPGPFFFSWKEGEGRKERERREERCDGDKRRWKKTSTVKNETCRQKQRTER